MDFQLDEGIAILERTPAVLRALLNGLPDAWTPPPNVRGPLGVYDGVQGLINAEHVLWIPWARSVLAQDRNQRLEPYKGLENRGKSLSGLLDEFARLRQESLATVRSWNLSERELALVGEFPGLGPFTVRQWLANWAASDLTNIGTTTRTMAREYRDAVGPFCAHLKSVPNTPYA
jgi:hypothetical protein